MLSALFRVPDSVLGIRKCALRFALYSMLHALCAMLSSLSTVYFLGSNSVLLFKIF